MHFCNVLVIWNRAGDSGNTAGIKCHDLTSDEFRQCRRCVGIHFPQKYPTSPRHNTMYSQEFNFSREPEFRFSIMADVRQIESVEEYSAKKRKLLIGEKQEIYCHSNLIWTQRADANTYLHCGKWSTVLRYCNTVFTLNIRTPQLLTIYFLKFEPVQFTTRCCV